MKSWKRGLIGFGFMFLVSLATVVMGKNISSTISIRKKCLNGWSCSEKPRFLRRGLFTELFCYWYMLRR